MYTETQSPSIKDIQQDSEDLPSLSSIQSNESLDSWSWSSDQKSNSLQTSLSSSMSWTRPGNDDVLNQDLQEMTKKDSVLGEHSERKSSLVMMQKRKSVFRKTTRQWKSLDIDPK